MKATLEFILPDEQEEFKAATKAGAYKTFIHEFFENSLRRRRKYGMREKSTNELIEALVSEFSSLQIELEI